MRQRHDSDVKGSRLLVPTLLGMAVLVAVSAGAAAALETRTVSTYGRGVWWAISLVTTVGFVGQPPDTTAGAVLSACLMVLGFLLLAMVGASLAALFVREEERPRDEREASTEDAIISALDSIDQRLLHVEQAVRSSPSGEVEPAAHDRSSSPLGPTADGESVMPPDSADEDS